jgi:hypothetical protein
MINHECSGTARLLAELVGGVVLTLLLLLAASALAGAF